VHFIATVTRKRQRQRQREQKKAALRFLFINEMGKTREKKTPVTQQ